MSKRLLGFGDVQFDGTHPWLYEAGEKFLDWLDGHDCGAKADTEAVLVGDLTEKDVNPGNVVSQLYRLAKICSEKFSTTYFLVGNHDIKIYYNSLQHSLEFLKKMPGIVVVEQPEEIVTPNGFDCLFMPFLRPADMSCSDYYNSEAFTGKYGKAAGKKYDCIAGHWNKCIPGDIFMADGVKAENFSTGHWLIGHVHNRIDPDYTGSIWPHSIAENSSPYPRGIKIISRDAPESLDEYPLFLLYRTVDFGSPVPDMSRDGYVSAFTVINARTIGEAQERYPGLYIRGIVSPKAEFKVDDSIGKVEFCTLTDKKEALSLMLKDTQLKLSREAYRLLLSLFGIPEDEA